MQDPKKVAKNRHLGTIPQLCRAISSQLRYVSTIGKKLVKQQYLPYMSSQYSELRPTSLIFVWKDVGVKVKLGRLDDISGK